MVSEMLANGVLNYLAGFENNDKDGESCFFNWILSNGDRSQQRDRRAPTIFTHMFPAGSHKKIRSVNIHYHDPECIYGFSFYDKEGALLWKIWDTTYARVKTVLLEENEVIVGVVAKFFEGWQSWYTDF